MKKTIIWPAIVCLVVILLLLSRHPGQAQDTLGKYFPATGHYLKEPFLSFFEAEGGLQVWGPPITEAIIEENGHLIQYFRRARMECSTEVGDASEVHVSPLGELLGHRTPRTAPVSDSLIRSGLCRYFPDTGHNVCFSFLTFYLNQGGADIFGPPISELTVEPGMITQYFQRARIEWHTDALGGTPMQLGALGEEYFRAKGLDSALLQPTEHPPTPQAGTHDITVGGYVTVVHTEGAGLRFRAGAGLSHETIQMIEEGSVLHVIGGPEVADGFTWWYLDYQGSLGWCAAEWLVPIEEPNSP